MLKAKQTVEAQHAVSVRACREVVRGIPRALVHRRQYELWNEHALRNEQRRIAVIPAGECDHQVEIRNSHEDLPTVSTREVGAHFLSTVSVLDRIPEPAVLLATTLREIAQSGPRFERPLLRQNLLIAPASLVHHQLSQLHEVAWQETVTTSAICIAGWRQNEMIVVHLHRLCDE